MNKFKIFIFLFISTALYPQDANQIIKNVDRLMFPGAKSEIRLVFNKGAAKAEEYDFISYSKNSNQKIIIRFLAPQSIVGDDLLFIDQNVWSLDKKSGRIMKIPSNLTFGATGFSFGDVVRLNMEDNYSAQIVKQDNSEWFVNLTSKDRNAPYYRIELEVKKNGCIPVKGICFGRNNKIIKTMEYEDVKSINNEMKPTKVIVKTPLLPGQLSTLILESETFKSFPDSIFNKDKLKEHLESRY